MPYSKLGVFSELKSCIWCARYGMYSRCAVLGAEEEGNTVQVNNSDINVLYFEPRIYFFSCRHRYLQANILTKGLMYQVVSLGTRGQQIIDKFIFLETALCITNKVSSNWFLATKPRVLFQIIWQDDMNIFWLFTAGPFCVEKIARCSEWETQGESYKK